MEVPHVGGRHLINVGSGDLVISSLCKLVLRVAALCPLVALFFRVVVQRMLLLANS